MDKRNLKRRIVHLSDVHIPNDINKHHIHREVFDKLYKSLQECKPDIIVVDGDTLDNFIETSLEAEHLASEFIGNLSKISKVVHTIGNHEIRKSDLKRFSSIGTVINIMKNDNITLYDKSGFFDFDDFITFTNYSHLEKNIHPWRDINKEKDDNRFYIGLFHDVIYGCKFYSGITEDHNTSVKIDSFDNNDINMFGDIHLRQFFGKKSAYSGSLIQNNFGEDPEKHGYLIWDIYDDKTFECTEVDIKNDYTYITFNINEGFDYDNIEFDDKNATEKSFFRYVWNDVYYNFNNENHQKLEAYIHNKWNKNQIHYKKIKIFKSFDSIIQIDDNQNIEDSDYQQELFRLYLENNKIEEDVIQQILALDTTVNNLMEKHDTISGIVWNIDRFWVDNFKSYDKLEIDWRNIHGIIKLMGENQMGKSNLLDAISYICFGTTLYTNKVGGATREKHADNRYINNKRNKDYCNGGAVLDINGQKYTILRSTSREFNKNRTSIKSCQTKLEYYNGEEASEENKIVGENRIKSQKLIEQVLGEFSDFIRISLTTADNLSSLISIERSVFLDSLVRDAGHDIFERKLDVFKKYKKSKEENRLKLDINKEKYNIEAIETSIEENRNNITETEIKVKDIESKIEDKNNEKNLILQSKNVIDDDIKDFDLEKSEILLSEYKKDINDIEIYIKQNEVKISELPEEYDDSSEIKLKESIKKVNSDIYEKKTERNNFNNNILISNNKINENKKIGENLVSNYKISINNKIKDKNRDIEDIKNSIEDKIKTEKNNIQNNINKEEHVIGNLQKDYDILVSDGIKLKAIITEIENEITVMKASERCVVCGNLYKNDKDALMHQNNKIKELEDKCGIKNSEIENIRIKARELKEKINNESKNKLEKYKEDLNNIISHKYNETLENEINNLKSNIISKETEISELEINKTNADNSIFTGEINDEITSLKKTITEIRNEISDNEKKISEIDTIITNFETELRSSDELNSKFQKLKSDFESRNKLVVVNREKQLIIENKNLLIGILENKIIKFNNNINLINFNRNADISVKEIDSQIIELKNELIELNKLLNKYIQDISIKENSITIILNNILEYEKQVKLDELYKLYSQAIDRGGIPTMLIMKSRDMINKYISDLLCDCNFNVLLDENLELQLTSDNSDANIDQNLLTSCGKEKTFGVMALRFALREINNKSKCNICIMDEVCGKLDKKSIKDFNEMLKAASKRIDKIIVIEHNVDIDFDVAYLAVKNKQGISDLQLVN